MAGMSLIIAGLGFLLKTGGLKPLPRAWLTASPVQDKLDAFISWATPCTFLPPGACREGPSPKCLPRFC